MKNKLFVVLITYKFESRVESNVRYRIFVATYQKEGLKCR